MGKTKIRTFAKLGYSHMDTAEIILHLNKLLASYNIYALKLRNFCWNVVGQDFFKLHEHFGKMYQITLKYIDDLAMRIRLFGKFPYSTLNDFLSHSNIKEPAGNLTSIEMAREVLNDIRTILLLMEECVQVSAELGDYGTETMLKSFIYRIEQDHWMLTAWLNESITER